MFRYVFLLCCITVFCYKDPDEKCERFNASLIRYLFDGKTPPELSFIGGMLLSSGSNLNDLGDYEKCRTLEEAEYFRVDFDIQLVGNTQIGLCYYKHCSGIEVEKALNQIRAKIEAIFNLKVVGVAVTRPALDDKGNKVPVSWGTYLFLVIFFGIIFTNLVCTALVNYFHSDSSLVKAFDLKGNVDSMFTFRASSLNGVRSIAMWAVVYGHIYYIILLYGTVKNPTEIKRLLSSPIGAFVISCFYSVDVFFFISGFLFRLTMNKIKIQEKLSFFFKAVLLRFLRLIPLLILLIFGTHFGLPLFYLGPNQEKTCNMSRNCHFEFWKIILFVQNIFIPSDCVGHSWYLADDMQFFIFSLIVMLIFVKPSIQDLVYLITFAISLVYTYMYAYSRGFGYNEYINTSENDKDYFNDFYIQPFHRIQPYILGLVWANFTISEGKRKKVNLNDSTYLDIYTSINDKITSKYWLSMVYHILGIVLVSGSILINYIPNNREERLSKVEASLYNTFSNVAMTLGVAILHHLSNLAEISWFDALLSGRGFDLFTKIGLAVYLFHHPLLVIINENISASFFATHRDFFVFGVSLFGMTVPLAIGLTLMFDSPVAKLIKSAFKK